MASTGYVANLFTAGEQPTTALWNQLWENDASFNTGSGFNDGIIISRHLAAGIQVSTVEKNAVNFRYYRAAAWNTSNTVLAMDTLVYDTGGNYNTSTGFFTAPVSGYYIIGGTAGYHQAASTVIITSLAVNGTGESYRWHETDGSPGASNYHQSGVSEIFLNQGNTVGLFVRCDNLSNGITGAISTNFWGSLRSVQ